MCVVCIIVLRRQIDVTMSHIIDASGLVRCAMCSQRGDKQVEMAPLECNTDVIISCARCTSPGLNRETVQVVGAVQVKFYHVLHHT